MIMSLWPWELNIYFSAAASSHTVSSGQQRFLVCRCFSFAVSVPLASMPLCSSVSVNALSLLGRKFWVLKVKVRFHSTMNTLLSKGLENWIPRDITRFKLLSCTFAVVYKEWWNCYRENTKIPFFPEGYLQPMGFYQATFSVCVYLIIAGKCATVFRNKWQESF